ncbi:hypothetical protein ES319_D02G023400v1 [Gossypium barbadense]|uniref:Agglutinin domain-containing protein n=1 Tax=Gossypium barbadense TaxID=3634 RepID=A0A5J5SEP9_GOSBA|nr:hypothetical protein ES319_D02G023400v1 [Gossypium barbadense]
MALTLPKFIVLKPSDNNGYLSYVREGENNLGFLKFFETQAVSPYAKFEVEISDTSGLVHIRSCQNNKYWQRTKTVSIAGVPPGQYWITATAQNKEEDQSKETCTLFKFAPIDHATGPVRIVHVQSGCNLCLWLGSDLILNRCVSANYREFDSNGFDIFSIIDCKSLLVLPKYVAFKGYNNKYLCVRENYITFSADDIGDSTVACETFVADDGKGNIEMSGEFHSDVKWEETKESKTLVDVVHKIVVPAMTKVTVNLIATKGKCDVPFTFMQSDTLYDGTIVTTAVQGATYTGSNYYSIHFETEETKLEPRKKPDPM